MDTRKIGRLIAKRRKELQMTQQILADKLSVTNKAVSKWETGQGVPDVSLLKSLANILEITVDELLDGEEEETFTLDNSFETITLTKDDYFHYIKEEQFYKRRLRVFVFLVSVLCFCGGIALKDSYRYLGHHFDIIGLVMILCGIVSIVYYCFSKYLKRWLFKEKNVSYLVNKEGLLYQELGKETMFYYSQFSFMYVLDDKIVLKLNKQLLWIDKKYLDFMKSQSVNLVDYTSSTYQKRQWSSFIGLSSVFMLCVCLMLGYHVVLKRVGFEMIFDSLNIMIWLCMILCIVYMIVIWIYRIDIVKALIMVIIGICTIGGSWFIGNALFNERTIYSMSPDFSNQLVLKQDKDNGKLTYYHYTFLCFAKRTNQMVSDISYPITTKWITNDCNLVTYGNDDQKEVFVATYGDRGNGISYYNVIGSMQGNWIKKNDNDLNYKMSVDDNGVTIKYDNQEDTFLYSDIEQNGTISVTLYDSYQKPQYVIVMNENCTLNQDYILKNDGSIQLIDLNNNNISVEMFCTTYKEDEEVQKQIDEDMEESAKNLIKKMQDILANDPDLSSYESN